jgi:aspartate/methionine/tyrosine aminotransferase
VRRAGGVPVFVALTPPDWAMPLAALRAALTPRTRALILNDPLNPTGTVTTPAERAALAALCVEADLVAICDEVWEVVRFDGQPHASLMAEPGMAHRTIKIGSAGKILAPPAGKWAGWWPTRRCPAWSPARTSSSPSPRRPCCNGP